MICFDEFGPIEVRPYHGRAWRKVRHPARLRATYRRLHGTRQYLAAYDVDADRLMMRCYRRKRSREVLLFLTHIRSRYPLATRLYLVLDNFSPHKRREVTDWAADHNVELVFTPTYASWLNRIEAIFSGVRYFALANSDYPDHAHSRRAILAYVRGATGIATPSSSNAGKNTRCFSLRGTSTMRELGPPWLPETETPSRFRSTQRVAATVRHFSLGTFLFNGAS